MLYHGGMTKLVGVLNVTPDSFSDGGLFNEPQAAIARAVRLFEEGADLVDIGAESTRPGAKPLSTGKEWQRLLQILQQLIEQYPEQISVDTYHPETAAKALELGDVVINDVTGMTDPAMIGLVAKRRARCVISHLPASTPQAAHAGELVNDIRQVADELLPRPRNLRAGACRGNTSSLIQVSVSARPNN